MERKTSQGQSEYRRNEVGRTLEWGDANALVELTKLTAFRQGFRGILELINTAQDDQSPAEDIRVFSFHERCGFFL